MKFKILPTILIFFYVCFPAIASEVQLRCSFQQGKASFPDGTIFEQQAGIFQFIFNQEDNEFFWGKGGNKQERFEAKITETEIQSVFVSPEGNIWFFNISRQDGFAYHEYRSPYSSKAGKVTSNAIGKQNGECSVIDPNKRKF